VNEGGVAAFEDRAARRGVLAQWTAAGMELGNHTFSHADFNAESIGQFEAEVVKGEASIGPLMHEAGKTLRYFRFPMNHTGDSREKRDAALRVLAGRGYEVATCTIENEDYEFERAFRSALAARDEETARKLRAEYLRYTALEVDYYAGVHRQLFGRETPQVMLLHVNRLNAEMLEEVLRLFEERGYRFVTLAEAQSDAAFRTPESVTKFGPMWGYRWAPALKAKIDGSKEPETPDWIAKYGR
jgi:peptidoglycan/xylan/chitin deacetylase (PgdA/CDA1 family)